MANSIDPFSWNPKFIDYKKNIIEDDIIPDELLEGIKNKIKSHCLSNYQSYKPSANVGYTTSCNDTGGTSNCNCDIQGVYGYPSGEYADSSHNNNNISGCTGAGLFGQAAAGINPCNDKALVGHGVEEK